LSDLEEAITLVNKEDTFDEAVGHFRNRIELQGGRRWLRRRVQRVNLAMVLVVTILAVEPASVTISEYRSLAEDHLQYLPTPLGFSHRPLSYWKGKTARQHRTGPDPPK